MHVTTPYTLYGTRPGGVQRVRRGRRVTVAPWQRGLLVHDGRIVAELDPGARRVWLARATAHLLDMRPWIQWVPTQEVPTADGVTLKVTLGAELRITDPRQYLTGLQDPVSAVYLAVQVALREVAASRTVEDLVAGRPEITDALAAAVRVDGDAGLAVDRVEVRDIILPTELKRAQAQVLLAKAEGQAALERARAETAALRALANAARLVDGNPALLDLRLLQQLAASTGHTVVIGGSAGVTPIPVASRSSGDAPGGAGGGDAVS
jgi:regulator of protease activity HflC (stomatin/prohibitin superfamily)